MIIFPGDENFPVGLKRGFDSGDDRMSREDNFVDIDEDDDVDDADPGDVPRELSVSELDIRRPSDVNRLCR